jgi:transposase-like protein
MSLKTSRLSPKQHQAIDLLSSGKTIASVCELLDVNRKTISRWKQSQPFNETLTDRIAQTSAQAMNELRALKLESVATLRSLLQNPETPANVAATIAFKILEVPEPAVAVPSNEGISERLLTDIRERVYGIYD